MTQRTAHPDPGGYLRWLVRHHLQADFEAAEVARRTARKSPGELADLAYAMALQNSVPGTLAHDFTVFCLTLVDYDRLSAELLAGGES